MPIPPELLLAAASLLAAIAAGVVWLSLRRRTTPSDHPHCRKCRFDLFGLPSTSDRCPECGTPLSHPRATVDLRILARRRRRMIAVLAVLLSIIAVGSAWRFIHNPQHTALQPNLVLLYLMERDAHAMRAESALVHRLMNNQLGSTSHAIIRFRVEYWLERRPPPLQMWRQTQVHKELVIAAIGHGVIAGAQRDALLERLAELTGIGWVDDELDMLAMQVSLGSDSGYWSIPCEIKLLNVNGEGEFFRGPGPCFPPANRPITLDILRYSGELIAAAQVDCEVVFTITPPGRETELVRIRRTVEAQIKPTQSFQD